MYASYPSFILGFHGCDHNIAEKVFSGKERLKSSANKYDWLGNRVYFWEQNPLRALEYAQHLKENPRKSKQQIENPAIVGAVIDLGYCFNLLDSDNLYLLGEGYSILQKIHEKSGLPQRIGASPLLKNSLHVRVHCYTLTDCPFGSVHYSAYKVVILE